MEEPLFPPSSTIHDAPPENTRAERAAFGKRMSRLLFERDMTQAALSRACGIKEHLLSKYANGLSMPKTHNMKKIAKALSVPLSALAEKHAYLEEVQAIPSSSIECPGKLVANPDFVRLSSVGKDHSLLEIRKCMRTEVAKQIVRILTEAD